jgi:hypothetical protein
MDSGFMRALANDYTQPSKTTNRVVLSYDGFTSYLIIVDAATWFLWIFLTKSKEPPLDIVKVLMRRLALSDGRFVRTDQGGELAQSSTLRDMLLRVGMLTAACKAFSLANGKGMGTKIG